MKGKTESILVVVVKWRHRENDLFLKIENQQIITVQNNSYEKKNCVKLPIYVLK